MGTAGRSATMHRPLITQRSGVKADVHDTDSGKADVLHVVKVGIKAFCEAAQGKGLAHGTAGRSATMHRPLITQRSGVKADVPFLLRAKDLPMPGRAVNRPMPLVSFR